MLLLFETAAGHALYELKNEAKLKGLDPDKLALKLNTEGGAAKALTLKKFAPFRDTTEAVTAATDFVESKLNKQLKKFLKKEVTLNGVELGVADPKLGAIIKEKLDIPCVANSFVNECLRGARSLAFTGDEANGSVADSGDVRAMQLGLSHSLSRYKLKFSPDKVDTMVVQAVGLLDDLDKEVNTYAMRVKEWYGWHFPEMARLVNDNVHYAELVRKVKDRTNFKNSLEVVTEVLDDDETAARNLLETAELSMGTEVDPSDMDHVVALADQVVELSAYRKRLADYLRARMQALAPNLTTLVGELVGARLVQHAGSIMNLAKQPASTVQILGAEKALFRALKTKHDTPKYGLIYHASLIGQAAPKNKGKIARVLAAKCSLAVRVDALGDGDDATLGIEARAKVEARLRQLEGGALRAAAPNGTPKRLVDVVSGASAPGYSAASDMVLSDKKEKKKKKKRKAEDDGDDDEAAAKKAKKSAKKAKKEAEEGSAKKKKKKDKK